MALTKATLIDLNANELILDLDADTSITADTDDTIHFKIGGSDEITITTTALSPSTSDGNALGTAALEWADLFLADAAVISLGADQDVTLTHVHNEGLLLNSTMKLEFNDASQFVQGSSATVLSIGATDEIDLTATLIDINGNLDVSGTVTIGNAAITEAELEQIDGITAGTALASKALIADANIDITGLRNVTATGTITSAGFTIGSAAITEAELEILDGASVTTTELNLIDGGTARGTDALATGDGILINDAGTMKMTNVDTVRTYMEADSLPLAGGTMTGNIVGGDTTLSRVNLKDFGIVTNAIGSIGGGAQTIDLTLGNSVSGTVDTSTTTFTFSNPTASDELCIFSLVLVNGGSQTVNFPSSVDWEGGTAPSLTTSGTDILVFATVDGGTIWHGQTYSVDSKSP